MNYMQNLHHIFRIMQLLVTIAVVVFAGVLILSALPVRGNIKLLTVLSGSMAPEIPVGSAVVIRPVDNYRTDQVIAFKPEKDSKELVTHRIVAWQTVGGVKQFITKGDANEEPDRDLITPEQIAGAVWLTIPYMGYAANWMKTPAGFAVLIILPAAILIYGELMAIRGVIADGWMKRADKGRTALKLTVPMFLLGILGLGLIKTSKAFFFDEEMSQENVITAWIEEVTPTPTEEPTPIGEPTLTPTPTPTPTEGANLVINELLANPASDFTNEWVEIYNPTGADVNLTDWRLKDAANPAKSLTGLGIISAGGFQIYTDNSWLNNTGSETLQLLYPGTNVVDEVTYSGTTPDKSYGRETDGGLPWKTCGSPTQGSSNNGSC